MRCKCAALLITITILIFHTLAGAEQELASVGFTAGEKGEAIVMAQLSAPGYNWSHGAWNYPLVVTLDDVEVTTLIPVRGAENAKYALMLGPVTVGEHVARLIDPVNGAQRIDLKDMDVRLVNESSSEYISIKYAPFILGRDDNANSDIPLLSWVEMEENDSGTTIEYSVIWSNEDGGTLTAELMSRYGRTVDIEWVYRVVLDDSGNIMEEKYQGKGHRKTDFKGRKIGAHPLLRTCTVNNMVCDDGESDFTFSFVPDVLPGPGTRERMLDSHPWVNRIMLEELEKEKKIVRNVPDPFLVRIAHPRLYALVDLNTEYVGSGLKLEAGIRVKGRDKLYTADMGDARMLLKRSGWARVGVWLPKGTKPGDLMGVRLRAVEGGSGFINVISAESVILLDKDLSPHKINLRWSGSKSLRPGGKPVVAEAIH